MKKMLNIAAGFLVIVGVSCGGNDTTATVSEPAHEIKEDLSANPDYKAGLALVAQSNCLTCHAVNQTTTGPSYNDISAKYAGADAAQITTLAKKIIEGGSGNWGSVPMIPHPAVSQEDAEKMVKYILLLKKQ